MFQVLYLFLKLCILDTEDIDEDREGHKNSGSVQELALNVGEKKARDFHRKAVICCDRGPGAAKEALLSLRYVQISPRAGCEAGHSICPFERFFQRLSSRIKELSKRSSGRKEHSGTSSTEEHNESRVRDSIEIIGRQPDIASPQQYDRHKALRAFRFRLTLRVPQPQSMITQYRMSMNGPRRVV